jgi:hypothetical protein
MPFIAAGSPVMHGNCRPNKVFLKIFDSGKMQINPRE